LEAAEAVCLADGEPDALSGLSALVDQSLVQQHDRDGEPCFTMLATLREFALEQLAASGETDDLRRRHAAFYTALTEQAATAFWHSGRLWQDLLQPLDTERENLLAALGWAVDQPTGEIGLRLVGALGVWFQHREPGEGRRWAERVLALPGTEQYPHARGLALVTGGVCAFAQGDVRAATAAHEEAVVALRAAEDLPALSRALAHIAAALPPDDAARALACSAEALTLARALGEDHTSGHVEMLAGMALLGHDGDLVAARGHLDTALRV
jgi:hypothetical protein